MTRCAGRGPLRMAWRGTIGVLLLLVFGGVAAAQDASLEYAIKATYLYKFIPFVDWPAGAFASPTAPITLCVVGTDPFGDVLDAAVRGQDVAGRQIAVERRQVLERSSGCALAYIVGSAAQSVADALAAVKGLPVLTVTDGARASPERGIINFVIVDNRVRFQIDSRAAAGGGLSISSKLQTLAVPINADTGGGGSP